MVPEFALSFLCRAARCVACIAITRILGTRKKVKYQMTPGELLTEVLRYKSFIARGGVTVTGGEPLLQPEFLKEFFRLCQEQGLHTALDTSGFVCTSKAWEVLDYADLVLLDIKTLNPDLHPLLAGVKQDNTLLFLDELERRGHRYLDSPCYCPRIYG